MQIKKMTNKHDRGAEPIISVTVDVEISRIQDAIKLKGREEAERIFGKELLTKVLLALKNGL